MTGASRNIAQNEASETRQMTRLTHEAAGLTRVRGWSGAVIDEQQKKPRRSPSAVGDYPGVCINHSRSALDKRTEHGMT